MMVYRREDTPLKVMICAPTQVVGGITSWAGYVVDYFGGNQGRYNIVLKRFAMDPPSSFDSQGTVLTRIYRGSRYYLKMLRRFKKELVNDASSVDVVHICSSGSFGLLRDYMMLKACTKRGLRTSLHFHFGRIPEIKKSDNWEWKLLRKILRLSDRVIVLDNASFETLHNAGYENVYVLPNPLSPKVEKLADATSSDFSIRNLIYVGHILEAKGVYELLEATDQIPDINIIFVGKDTISLQQNVTRKNVFFLGERPIQDVLKAMKSGVFVFPSHTEGFPNVILESMICGAPIIASRVGAIPEMIEENGECGMLIPPKNVDRLRSAIIDMMSEPERALAMGCNARQRVRQYYSIEKVMEQLFSIWNA